MRVNQFWFPATTWACTWTPAARYCPPGISLRIASASSSVSVVDVPEPPRTPPWEALPALTVIMFVPAPLIWSSIMDVAPLPIATSVITADTPMIMPSMVRAVRILLRPSALNAIRNVITGDMALPASTTAAVSTAAAVAAARSAGASTARAAGAHERRESKAGRRTNLFQARVDVRHQIDARLDVAFEQFGLLSIGDAEPQAHGFQLLLRPDPDLATRFDLRQRPEQRVNGRRIATACWRTGRCAGILAAPAPGVPPVFAAAGTHARHHLFALLGRHVMHSFGHSRRIAAARVARCSRCDWCALAAAFATSRARCTLTAPRSPLRTLRALRTLRTWCTLNSLRTRCTLRSRCALSTLCTSSTLSPSALPLAIPARLAGLRRGK